MIWRGSLTLNPGTISLPLDGEESIPGTVCWVSGWGTTSEGGSMARVLMKVEVTILSAEDCFLAYDGVGITGGMMCAGDPDGGKGFCQGDSGSPLMCPFTASDQGDQLQLTGIASWSYGCAEPGFPGVYTETSYYIPWIMDNM